MATTPPPQVRIHTPSTPLHGPRFDPSSAFSPRRSSRVAAQRSRAALSSSLSPTERYNGVIEPRSSSSISNNLKTAAASATPSPGFARSGRQPFSPPLSPINSPLVDRLAGSSNARFEKLRSKQTYQAGMGKQRLGDEVEDVANSELLRETFAHTNFPTNMLPTPKKTPRKRRPQGDVNASGILLAGRSLNIDDAMPTPRKSKRSRKQLGFTLDSFTAEDEEGSTANDIPIYTDSKERIPSLDQNEDNPFVGPPKVRGKNDRSKRAKKDILETPQKTKPQRQRPHNGIDADSDKDREDGIVYVFRGKKIFRKFNDVEEQDDNASFDGHDSGHDLRRRIGHAATRPLERASIKPRLLWPSKEQTPEHDTLEEEEAPTDIEDPDINITLGHAEDISHSHATSSKTHSARTRQYTEQTQVSSSHSSRMSYHLQNGETATTSIPSRKTRRSELADVFEEDSSKRDLVYKASPFSSWTRTKAGQASTSRTKGTKRDADVAEPSSSAADAKRVRSGLGDAAL